MPFSNKAAYIAMIGDMVHSKEIANRGEVQLQLKEVLLRINTAYSADIAARFMITLGDEFQGLLHRGENTMNILGEIEQAMQPTRLRFGVGVGEITTEIDPTVPLGADGPAYYRAREMITQLKARERKNKEAFANVMVASGAGSRYTDELLNSVLSLAGLLKEKWTRRQTEIIAAYRACGENQYQAAEKLGIRQASVNKALAAAGYYSYQKAVASASGFLGQIGEGNG
ncbi:MAG: SatD family protein [Oscillospiraceae bacterium]